MLATDTVATLLDPICRATELGLKPQDLKKLRTPLERCGAIVARSIVYEEPHRHTSELARWEVHPGCGRRGRR